MRKRIVEEPFKSIIDREWLRAKRILPHTFKRKPSFYWTNTEVLGPNIHARCHRYNNTIVIHHWFKRMKNHKEFVLLLRHEFAHLPRPAGGSHGEDFMWWMNKLGGTRHTSGKLRTLVKAN